MNFLDTDLKLTLLTMLQLIALAFFWLVLKKLEMDQEYEGNVEATGEDFSVEPAESRWPFRALLDVGLVRTTTGNRVFGAQGSVHFSHLGALGGGLDIPRSDKRFAGFKKDDKQLDAEVHRKYIFGGHVSSYMRTLMEDEPEKYQMHFRDYIKRGREPDSMEELYKKVHAASRADPTVQKSTKEPPKEHKTKMFVMLMKMLEDIPVNFLIMLDNHLLRFPQVHPLAIDIVVKLLTFDPRQRITAQDLRMNFLKAADQIGKWIRL